MKKAVFLFLITIVLVSCARVGSPVGGTKDTIPPQVVGANIDSSRVKVPRNINELRIDFDEYITLKDINKNLIVSPPLKHITKILPSGMANKFLLIKWTDTLQANTTYNFNFGNAIVDNNESNPLRYYNFAFSTGDEIDNLYISGELSDRYKQASQKTDDKNMVVGLYKAEDSTNFRQKPYYIAKADEDGYFELNYLTPGKYRLLAFDDENANSVFDAGKERVGFLKDPIDLTQNISGLKLNLFPSKKAEKYLEMKETAGGVVMLFEGHPSEVKVKSINEKLKDYQVTHQPKSDSVRIWFDATKNGLASGISENLKFSYATATKSDTVSLFYRYDPKNTMTISNAKGNQLAPESEFSFLSNFIIDKIQPEKWKLVSDSISQEFTARINKANPFEILVHAPFKEGKKYELTVPKETVSSFYSSIDKSYRFDFESAKTENFGSLEITLENAPTKKFWLELLNESHAVAYSRLSTETKQTFAHLKPGKYTLRILVDNNENGIWDYADLAKNEFAEDLYLFAKPIEIRPMWEIRETWNLLSDEKAEISKDPTQQE